MATATMPIPARSFRAKVTSKGVVTIPVMLRRSEGINPGDYVSFELPQDHSNFPVHSVKMSICMKTRGISTDSSSQDMEIEANQSE
jgi:bifunctional DNA-binding transcriptional regulator/antitoxin component of YhaV-PrlF toxin-antitoxin module